MKDNKPSKEIVAAQMQVVTEAMAPWRSQVLFSLFDIGVFDLLDNHPMDCKAMAVQLKIAPDSLKRLVNCGASLEFLVKKGSTFHNSFLASEVLVKGKPGYLGNWLSLAARWYHSFGKLAEGIRDNRWVEDVNFTEDPLYRDMFVKGMIDYARYRGRDILNHLDLSHCNRLLDLGCGPAVYSVMFCEQYPDLECICLDLPHAVNIARDYLGQSEIADRITFVVDDYRKARSFGRRFDVAFLSHVLHQEDKAGCMNLLKKCYTALNPKGFLVVQAMFPDTKGMQSPFTALHDLLALLIFPGGKNHTVSEVSQWLEAVGLVDIRHQQMSLLNINSLVIGTKPVRKGERND